MTIQRQLSGFRFVETNRGDTLQAIALRELGDASRWPELVAFNNLLPPFITDDPEQERDGVMLTGRLMRVPAAEQVSNSTVDSDLVFERDVRLEADGELAMDGGDFAMVSGLPNLRQALVNRLTTDRGELSFHPVYGSQLRRIVGTVNGPTAALLASAYAKDAVQQDARILAVTSAIASVTGDRVDVQIVAEPVVGRAVELNVST